MARKYPFPGQLFRTSGLSVLAGSLVLGTVITVSAVPAQAGDSKLAAAEGQAIDPASLLGATSATIGVPAKMIENPTVDLNGWEYLYLELSKAGIDQEKLIDLFTDRRMPERETLYFGLNPRESRHLYRKHNSKIARKHALNFYRDNFELFTRAEKTFGVPKSVVLSILQVETGCGGNTGSSRVFYQLARLAIAADPANIEKNLDRLPESARPTLTSRYVDRANYLRDTFLPHVAGAVRLAERLKIDPLELRGSAAGAVGMGQFLPGNVIALGVDGDGDSSVDPFAKADAVMSVANFLKHHGWKEKGMSARQKRSVIWHYNRSDAYIDTVLAMARMLEPQLCSSGICPSAKGARKAKASSKLKNSGPGTTAPAGRIKPPAKAKTAI